MTEPPGLPKPSRRHDLDALRAFAMSLGIALHGALSFTGFPWMVQDLRPSGVFVGVFAAIHGFRMPLFILVSGYFTMMLWRSRGMKGLLVQRAWRVLVPCWLGVFTIVPTLDWAGAKAQAIARAQDARTRPGPSAQPDLVEATRRGDRAAMASLLDGGADPNLADPTTGIPPLAWAAMIGDEAAAGLLLDRGADPNRADRSGYRPLHSAAFLGHPGLLDLLIRRGADPKARGPRDDTAIDSTRTDAATTRAIVASLRVPTREEDELQAGRAECRALLGPLIPAPAGSIAPAAPGGWESVRRWYAGFLASDRFLLRRGPWGEPFHLILTPVFDHLWFLWFLCWLVAIFAVVAPLADRLATRRVPATWTTSPLRWAWVVPLTMIPQSLMATLGPSFGPDTSLGLLPQPHLLVYYGIFFAFGALFHDADDRDGRLGRMWWLTLPLALLVLLPLGLATSGQVWISGALQVAYAWALCFALIGLFRRALSQESRTIRYLSDSAYWLYLAHLPVVVLLQAWVRDRDWPAAFKFALVCTLTTAALLASYQLLVRHTPIGRLLNGPRPIRANGS